VNWAIRERGYWQRRTCGLAGIDPRVYRYRSTRPGHGTSSRCLCERAADRGRLGYLSS
jgi:putative transposase